MHSNAIPTAQDIDPDRFDYHPNDVSHLDGIGGTNIVHFPGTLNSSEPTTFTGIDIFGFTSGSPLPPPSPAPQTTNNTQYSLLGGTKSSTVSNINDCVL